MQQTKKPEENKIKTRQKIKKGGSKRCCHCQSTWLIIAPLSHCFRSAVALPLSLLSCAAVAPLSHRYCSTVAPLLLLLLLLRSRTAIPPILRHCHSAAVAPAVATQSHHYHTAIAPLLLRCCCSCCCYAVSPLSLRCRTVVEPLSLRPRENINKSKLN